MSNQLINRLREHLVFKAKLEQEMTEKATTHGVLLKDLHKKGNEIDSSDFASLKSASMVLNMYNDDLVKLKTKIAELFLLYSMEKTEEAEDFSEADTKTMKEMLQADVFLHNLENGELKLKMNDMMQMMQDKIMAEPFDKEQVVALLSKLNSYGA